jgi:hypothetical protein
MTRDRQGPLVWEDLLSFIRDPQAPLPSGAPTIPGSPTQPNAPIDAEAARKIQAGL